MTSTQYLRERLNSLWVTKLVLVDDVVDTAKIRHLGTVGLAILSSALSCNLMLTILTT